MSADRLREAARVLRDHIDGLTTDHIRWDDAFPVSRVYADKSTYERLIVHPGVGLALADWLDVVSGWLDEGLGLIPPYSNIGDAWADIERQAYSLADLILGAES